MSVVVLPFPSYADRPLRILRPDLSARIRAVNALLPRLEAWGVSFHSQDLMHAGPRPRIRVRGVPSSAALRYAMAMRRVGTDMLAVIDDVDVLWAVQ